MRSTAALAHLQSGVLCRQLGLLVVDELGDVGLHAHVVRQAARGGVVDGRERQVVDKRVAILLVVEQLRVSRACVWFGRRVRRWGVSDVGLKYKRLRQSGLSVSHHVRAANGYLP